MEDVTVHAKRWHKLEKTFSEISADFALLFPFLPSYKIVIAHLRSEIELLLYAGGENQLLQKRQLLCVYAYCVMFLVMHPHISWSKIRDSSAAAVEDKALDKYYKATRSVLTTKGRFRSREQ